MIDPALERRYADCQELVEAWRSFLEFYHIAVKSPENINPQNEQGFLNSKARVAMLHDSFMDSLTRERTTGANMLGLINRSITLRHLNKLGAADHKKMEIEWHEIYLLLSDTVTALEEERQRLADVSQTSANMKKMTSAIAGSMKQFFGSIYFKILVLAAILFALFGSLLIFEDELRQAEWSKKHFTKVLAFERNVLGLQAPYSDFAEFAAVAFQPRTPAPDGLDSWTDNGMSKETVASLLGVRMNPEIKDLAAKATSGGAYDVKTANNAPQTLIGVLVFFSAGEANQFETKFREVAATKSGLPFEAVRKVNVVAIVAAPDASIRGQLKSGLIDPVTP